jgi:hypothetical protein
VARRGDETIYVEVKGTTTTGQSIILTRNEVAHHQANYPNSCLILVSGILMLTASPEPTCTGGTVQVWHSWKIEDSRLSVLAYEYSVPSDEA